MGKLPVCPRFPSVSQNRRAFRAAAVGANEEPRMVESEAESKKLEGKP